MALEKLYLEAARVAKLEKQYPGIYPIKFNGNFFNSGSLINGIIAWLPCISEIEFALAIVEGKPVFKGDVLWNKTLNMRFIAELNTCAGIYSSYNGSGAVYADCSWNPPKPRTVMVELTVEDAEWLKLREDKYKTMNVIAKACHKALKELE